MVSALLHRSPSKSTDGSSPASDRWAWPRAVLLLPVPLLLIVAARREGVASPLLDRADSRLVGLLAAFAGGWYCYVLADRLRRHGMPLVPAMFVGAAPGLAAYAAAPPDRWDMPMVISVALVTVALGGYLEFVVAEQTLGGFAAGITLALAAVSDLVVLGYMAALAAAVPFVAGPWARRRGATRAILAVLAFPGIAVYLGWLYIRWRFAGTAFGAGGDVPSPGAVDLSRAGVAVWVALAQAPLYLAGGFVLAMRRRGALPAYLLPLVVLFLLLAAGVEQPALVISLLCTGVAVTAVRARLSRAEWVALTVVAAAQVALTLAWAAV